MSEKKGMDVTKEAVDYLVYLLEKSQRHVYVKLEHVSKSGLSRSVKVYLAPQAGQILDVTHSVCIVLGVKMDRYDGVRMNGCNYDVAHYIVTLISRRLYGQDYSLTFHWL